MYRNIFDKMLKIIYLILYKFKIKKLKNIFKSLMNFNHINYINRLFILNKTKILMLNKKRSVILKRNQSDSSSKKDIHFQLYKIEEYSYIIIIFIILIFYYT